MPSTAEIVAYPASDMGELKSKDKPKVIDKMGRDFGAVHVESPDGNNILVNKNKVMVRTTDGKVVQVKDGQVQVTGKGGKTFNNGSIAPPPNPVPNPTTIVGEIMTFVNNLLKSIFGPK